MTSRVKEFDEELDENFERKGVEGWVTNNRKRGGAAQALRTPLASGPEQCRTHEQSPSRNDVNKFGKFDTFRNSVRPEIEHTSSAAKWVGPLTTQLRTSVPVEMITNLAVALFSFLVVRF